MRSTSRDTEIAKLLEYFLDNNVEYLPPNMFSELDDLAGEIDGLVKEELEKIEELTDDNKDLKQTNEELMEQIEKLEGELNE